MWNWFKNWGSGIQSGDVGAGGLANQSWYDRHGYQAPNYMINPSAMANAQLAESFVDNDAMASAYGAQAGLAAPAGGGNFGGGGGWSLLKPSTWSPGGVGAAGSLMGGIGALGGLYLGAKNYGLTKDMMDFQKKLGRANFENQATMAQTAMDRQWLYRRALGGVKGEKRKVLKKTV